MGVVRPSVGVRRYGEGVREGSPSFNLLRRSTAVVNRSPTKGGYTRRARKAAVGDASQD